MAMNDKALKTSVDQFLRSVSLTAKNEIEKAVRSAVATGKLQDHETFTAAVSLASEKAGLNITIYSKIVL
jgi:flagellar hook assembly protein FlgD